ncbi:VanZ family protein [Flavobacterium aquariorum]|uniref:VanZ family protein n=1 Tax=Flavobacterium aquariorum TaxID=2217670 RepID=UPI001FB2C721|nr:VanZ family protein [Flavobacterium aquariorum]
MSYFCLVNSNEIPVINIQNLDKCIHTFFHLVFTFVWFLFFQKQFQSDNRIKPLMYSFIFSFVFGIAIEILQNLITTTRSADVLDVLANVVGAILAVFMVVICNRFNILNSILKK